MAWTIEYDSHTLRVPKSLDRSIRREIVDYLDHRVATAENPRNFGKPLVGRAVALPGARLPNHVLVIDVGHRSTIYDD